MKVESIETMNGWRSKGNHGQRNNGAMVVRNSNTNNSKRGNQRNQPPPKKYISRGQMYNSRVSEEFLDDYRERLDKMDFIEQEFQVECTSLTTKEIISAAIKSRAPISLTTAETMSSSLFEGDWEGKGLGDAELNQKALELWAYMLIDEIQVTKTCWDDKSDKFTLTVTHLKGVHVEYVLFCRDVVEDLISGEYKVDEKLSFSVSPEEPPLKNMAVALITLPQSDSRYAVTKLSSLRYWTQFLKEADMTPMTYLRSEAATVNGIWHIYYIYDNINYLYPFFELRDRSAQFHVVWGSLRPPNEPIPE